MSVKARVVSSQLLGKLRGPRRRALWGACALIWGALASTAAAAQNSRLVAYVVMGQQGAVARAVVEGNANCPKIEIGPDQPSMDVRARPSSGFPVTVCEKLIPPGTKSASILGTPLPVPKNSLTSIVVFGDTGCRPKLQENCSANKWPFRGLSDNAAKSHPDLVIHVGDYRYRTPTDCASCDDDWKAWQDDFFAPAKQLLAAAPWIAARGNHEICSRGGRGYFLLLAPGESTQCKDDKVDIAPYTVTIGERQFIVFDSSGLPHEKIPDVERYTEQFKNAVKLVKPHSWFITHVPNLGSKGRGLYRRYFATGT